MTKVILRFAIIILFAFISINDISAVCPMMSGISGTQLNELIKGNAQKIGGNSYKLQEPDKVQKAIEDTLVAKIQAARDWINTGPKFFGNPTDPTKLAVSVIIPKQGPYYPIMGPNMSVFQTLKLLNLEFTPADTQVTNACTFQLKADVKGTQVFSQPITLIPAK